MNSTDDVTGARLLSQLRQLRGQPAPAVARSLAPLFADFGAVCRISTLETASGGAVFLVDFDHEAQAMRATRATGFKLFGFSTLVVDLAKLGPP